MSRWLAGAYTADMDGDARGIVTLESNPDGSLANTGLLVEADSPSFLATDGTTVFAALEAADSVATFSLDGVPIATVPAGGVAPCHLLLAGGSALVSCYVDGAVGVLDTAPLVLAQSIAGQGSGPHPAQDGPHAHSTFLLDDSTVLSADLGADRIHVHTLADGRLTRVSTLVLPAGSGPRDIRRHSSGRLLVLAELGLEVFTVEWDGADLTIVARTPIPGAEPGDHAAEVSLGPDERFAYVGLRGSNRIGVLAVAPDGTLTPVTSVDCGGDWPRHHAIDGDVLHVANQRSSTVASFRLGSDGIPTPIGTPTEVASPTFLLHVF